MASYSTRQRDPLLDSDMQAAIERRGKELIGIALILIGVMAATMIATYSPDDPNWMLATDAPVHNWMGRTGASLAAPILMIAGGGVWVMPLALLTWGLRLTLHMGTERALGRMVFVPIIVALGSIYSATLTPGPQWTHTFGLGGLFGDTVLGIILTVVPLAVSVTVKVAALISGLALAALGGFALGFTLREIRIGIRYFVVGLVLVYVALLRLLGSGATLSARAARSARDGVEARRAERQAEARPGLAGAQPQDLASQKARVAAVVRANPAMPTHASEPPLRAPGQPAAGLQSASARSALRAQANQGQPLVAPAAGPDARSVAQSLMPRAVPAAEPVTRPSGLAAARGHEHQGGLLSRLPAFRRKGPTMPEPELPPVMQPEAELAPRDEDRIRSQIRNAVRARMDAAGRIAPSPLPEALSPETPVFQRPVSPPHLVLGDGARAEPPVSAPRMPGALPGVTRTWVEDEDDDREDLGAARFQEGELQEYDDSGNDDGDAESFDPLDDYAEDDEVLDQAGSPYRPIPVFEPRRVVQHTPKRAPAPSRRAQAEAQPRLQFEERHPDYEHPPLNLLTSPVEIVRHHLSDEALEENARMLESVLDDYGVKGEIVSVRPGPVVTMYELEPAPGLKASRVIGLADDIARSMSALSARVSTVPGRSVIGIELPNAHREKVVLREILSARDFGDSNMKLPLALGKDIGGDPVVANLAKMPHLLIAGTTGSGKSVAINTMILSLLYKLTPQECRMIMIDPKMLELSVYDGIPHLLSPVVTDPKKAVVALKWVVGEMEERYRRMSKMGVRNIEGFNGRVQDALSRGEMFSRTVQTGFDDETGDPVFETEEFAPESMPYIVVVVDEMADLMMVAGKEIEACIQRLAQMARASGIHLIMATQRPSVDVITGTIKANFPTRISFQVTSKIDSRTILGEQGAEQLLGMGDMLYMAGGAKITRVHGPFVSDEEVEEIVNFLKGFGPPEYMSGVVDGQDEDKESEIDLVLGLGGNTDGEDALYDQAVAIVLTDRKCSTSYIQRKLAIGYNKAARLVEQMEDQGVVSSANHVGKREILVGEQH